MLTKLQSYEKRTPGCIYATKDANFQGASTYVCIVGKGGCTNWNNDWRHGISSFGPDAGTLCPSPIHPPILLSIFPLRKAKLDQVLSAKSSPSPTAGALRRRTLAIPDMETSVAGMITWGHSCAGGRLIGDALCYLMPHYAQMWQRSFFGILGSV
jgi:hypothetical protein